MSLNPSKTVGLDKSSMTPIGLGQVGPICPNAKKNTDVHKMTLCRMTFLSQGKDQGGRGLIHNPKMYETLQLGVVLRKTPGVTRWVSHHWTASGVLPGAGPADWRELRREGDAVEFHAATLKLELHGADTEAYVHGLQAKIPSVYVVMRPNEDDGLEVLLVTASPYEAQDYTDSGEEIVEKVPMPPALLAWVQNFVERFHEDEEFIKRKRDKKRIDLKEEGIGDPRIAQTADVYRAPSLARKERLQ